jgi:hypothetical protein
VGKWEAAGNSTRVAAPDGRLVQPGGPQQVQLSILGRDPPVEHHPARTPHSEPVAVPGGFRGVSSEGAVGVVGVDELFQIGEAVHWVHGMSSSVSTSDQPRLLRRSVRFVAAHSADRPE